MRKSRPADTISKILRRRSSQSLYPATPPPGSGDPAASGEQPLDKLDDILAASISNKGAMNMVTDSGTAKVKQRPTVKLTIPFQRNSNFAVPTPTVPDRALFSKIPRTSVMSGNDMKVSDNKPNVGDHGQTIKVPGDDWIPPPPPMAPPPPPTQNTFQHPQTTYLPDEVAVPPPPNMAPPPPPPPVNMASQQQPAPTYQPPETIFSPSPNMIPPPPPIMAPQKSLPKGDQFPKTSAPSAPKIPPPPPPLLLPPNDYSVPSPRQDDVSKPNQINHPKKSPPPPPQRDMVQHNNFPPKPARDASSSFKLFSNTSQTSVANNQSSYVAGSPEVISQPLIASTFNPKATAKLFGFSDPVNKSESSLDSDWQNKIKSMIVMKDAEQYPMDHTASVHKKDVSNKGTEHATMDKMHKDSVPHKPQKPARKNNLSVQQSKPFQNKGVHAIHSGSSTDHSIPDGKENTWNKNMDLRQTSTRQIHNSTNTQSFSSNPPVSAGMEFEKYRAGQKPKSTMKGDFENQSSSENLMFDYQSPKSVENPKTPESPPEQTLASTERSAILRSPLALLMAAKERDSKNQGRHKIGSEIPSLSLGGTRYIKSATSNTIHITPVADNKESSLLSHTQGDTTPQNKHMDDILHSLNSAEKSGKWSKPSLYSTSCRISEPEDTENDVDMSLLLIPPPPNFSDAENEKPPLELLPPPFEFSNHDDHRDYSFQPERKMKNESGVSNLHNSNRGLSIQQSTPDPPNHKNSLINKNSSSMDKLPLNTVLTPAKTSFNKQKPSTREKPTFVDSAVMNGGSTKFHNSKQVSDSHTYSHLMSKTSAKNVTKVEPHQTETVPPTNHLPAKNKVMDELQSKVQDLSTKCSAAASPSSPNAQVSQTYGRTFTVRPGTKQPITVVYPPTTK